MLRASGLKLLPLALALGACTQINAGLDRVSEMGGPAQGPGACGAGTRQDLVGQRVSVLDSSALPEGTRVLFPGMNATEDFNPGRLNIAIGTSDQIDRVYCG